jgi:hypothetical protein
MDSRILELWGRFLIQAAQNQQLLEQFFPGASSTQGKAGDFPDWMRHLFANLPYMQSAFPFSSGLEQLSESGRHLLQAYQESWEQWYKQCEDCAQLLGLVPQGLYEKKVQENQELQQKVQEQEQTIERLRGLLEQKAGMDLEQATQDLGQIFQEQNKQFSNLLQNLEQIWGTNSQPKDKSSGYSE